MKLEDKRAARAKIPSHFVLEFGLGALSLMLVSLAFGQEFDPKQRKVNVDKTHAAAALSAAHAALSNTPESQLLEIHIHHFQYNDDNEAKISSARLCIFGTHHAYQYRTVRRRYFQNVHDLIVIHGVDLVAEEFTAHGQTSYAEKIVGLHQISWKNVDLTAEERKHVPDLNPYSIGTQIDADLHSLREWVWVARTAKAMKHSALLICGIAHTSGIAEKFASAGFEVELHAYLDNADDKAIERRTEEENL